MTDAAAAANRRGILAMSAAMGLFIVNDALIKKASAGVPALQAICVRGAFASAWVFLMLLATGQWRSMGALGSRPLLVRASLDVLGSVAYLFALFQIPIATATAINLTTPLMLTALAVLVLGERVDARRWAAVAAGFLGVLLVVQPRVDGLNAWAWVALGATAVHSVRDLWTRWVPKATPSLVVTFSAAAAITLVTGAVALARGWQPMSGESIALLLIASLFLAAGYQMVVIALRTGEMAVVGAFRYTGLLWALLLGFVMWGEVPRPAALVGIVVIAAAGVYFFRRR